MTSIDLFYMASANIIHFVAKNEWSGSKASEISLSTEALYFCPPDFGDNFNKSEAAK